MSEQLYKILSPEMEARLFQRRGRSDVFVRHLDGQIVRQEIHFMKSGRGMSAITDPILVMRWLTDTSRSFAYENDAVLALQLDHMFRLVQSQGAFLGPYRAMTGVDGWVDKFIVCLDEVIAFLDEKLTSSEMLVRFLCDARMDAYKPGFVDGLRS